MTKFNDIFEEAVDRNGLITSAQATKLGVSNNELVQYAKRGKLTRVGQGVYRLTQWVPTPYDSYAEAVALAGPKARLYGESVIAMLELIPTNPAFIRVATTTRNRRKLPKFIKVVRVPKDQAVTFYEGFPSQTVADAIRSCIGTMMPSRLHDAVEEARRQGYLSSVEYEEIRKELQT